MMHKLMFVCLILLASAGLSAHGEEQAKSKPLTEAQVLKLIELQIEDLAIINRIRQGGGALTWVDPDALKRLKEAGASDAVLSALRPSAANGEPTLADDAARQRFAVHVTQWSSQDSGLESELRINGHLAGAFSSTSSAPIGQFIQMGWNTLTLRTKVRPGIKEKNSLRFQIGPVEKKNRGEKEVMSPVVWEFNNDVDWRESNGVIEHSSKPGTKEATLTFRLYYAGLAGESYKPSEGDYVLHHSEWTHCTPQITSTVFVNNRPLTTFLGQTSRNNVIITSMVTKGRNEIKVITSEISNILNKNDIRFEVLGPAEYNAKSQKYLLNPITKFHSNEGWEQDEKTGRWRPYGNQRGDRLERTVNFDLAEAPKGK